MMNDFFLPYDAGEIMNEVRDCADTCCAVEALCMLIDELIKEIQHLNVKYITARCELHCIRNRTLQNTKSSGDRKLDADLDEIDDELPFDDEVDFDKMGEISLEDYYGYDFFREFVYDGGDPMKFRSYLENLRRAREGDYMGWL